MQGGRGRPACVGDRGAAPSVRAGAAALTAALLTACAAPPFDLAALEREQPALAGVAGHRLGDATPYVLPWRDELLWFLCRWDARMRLRVALPPEPDATARQRALLRRALEAWQAAGLGVSFVALEAGDDLARADVAIVVVAPEDRRAGQTRSECGVVPGEGWLEARLVHAQIALRTHQLDTLGREVPLSEAEWLGAAVHELGHALGFQGHARRGPGPMVRQVEEVRRIGRRLLDGDPLEAPTLRALYALDSGTVLARVPLAPGRTAIVDRLARIAAGRGHRGPVVRVGDEAARIAWWSPEGRSVGVLLPHVRETLHDPSSLEIEPDLIARAWLGP